MVVRSILEISFWFNYTNNYVCECTCVYVYIGVVMSTCEPLQKKTTENHNHNKQQEHWLIRSLYYFPHFQPVLISFRWHVYFSGHTVRSPLFFKGNPQFLLIFSTPRVVFFFCSVPVPKMTEKEGGGRWGVRPADPSVTHTRKKITK